MPMAPEKLEAYKEVLLDKRRQVQGQVASLVKDLAESTEATENSKAPQSPAENAADTYEQDFAFISMESEDELLRKIEGALRRIEEGTYGTCADCEKDIKVERLEALPFTDQCIECASTSERTGKRRGKNADFEFEDDEPEPEE